MVFSGGYDPANDTREIIPSGTLGNALYIVDLETGGDKFFWSAGNNNDVRIKHQHTLSLNTRYSMAATPTTIDTNGDGAIDMIYALDINGGVWRIDLDGVLSTGGSGSGSISRLSAMGGKIANLSGEAGLQRFYNSLDISRTNPKTGINQYVIVTGSGYRAHPNDMADTTNKLFVVLDPNISPFRGDAEDKTSLYKYVKGNRIIDTQDLVETTASDFKHSTYGYFLPATAAGEKFLQPAITINNTLIISSFVPGENTDEVCSIGTGRTYFLDILSLKSRFDEPFAELTLPGIPPETSILRLPKISICVGTNCASAESSADKDDCDSANFTSEEFGSDFAAAVSSAICGLETGRAYRASWLER